MSALTSPILIIPPRSADSALGILWHDSVQWVAGLPLVAREATDAAHDLVAAAVQPGRIAGEHVHLANAYSVAVADEHSEIAEIFTDPRAWLLPDGRPLVWMSAARRDEPRLRQVRGPQFLLDVADLGRQAGLKHYLLGGSPEVLRDLKANLIERFPGVDIVGSFSPPFRSASDAELRERDAAIRDSGAQVVWVGLGTPKQDFEAARLAGSLPVLAVAVGAAFDYAAGSLTPAPHWVSVIGCEWLWRFAAEPRRLWKRYTIGNLRFIGAARRGSLRSQREQPPAERSRTVVVGQLPPPLHGSAIMAQRLIEALRRNGEAVSVVDRRFSRSVDEVGRPALRKLLAVPSLVARFLAATRGSERLILFITTTPASFLIDRLLLACTRRPVVLYVHTVGFRTLAGRSWVWRRAVRAAFRRADRVVVLGEALIEDVAPFADADRISVIPNATPSVPERAHEPGHRVLFLSNLLPGKGADVFLRSARALVEAEPEQPWAFDLAGAGDVTALGDLPERLTAHGAVQAEAKTALLTDADVLVVPSTYAMEAQPLVIAEAFAFGVPVVAYDNGGIRDLVDETVGALVPVGDEAALVAAVRELLATPERARSAGAAARLRYERRHSPRAYAKAWRAALAPRTAPADGAAAR